VTDAAKLQDEYARLVEGLQEADDANTDTDGFMANPGSTGPWCIKSRKADES
jgi:hypothetical protein